MNIITTIEGLNNIVSEDGWVTEHNTSKGTCVEVLGGTINLEGNSVKGMELYFNNCTIKGFKRGEGFFNCKLSIDNESIVRDVLFYDSVIHIRNSRIYSVAVNGGSLSILKNVHVEKSRLFPLSLFATQEQVVTIHKDGNLFGGTTTLATATASCGSFGTYNGNIHYFKDSDTVIAGCWQGKLDEFKDKAKSRLVPRKKYEAVYNYFTLFKY